LTIPNIRLRFTHGVVLRRWGNRRKLGHPDDDGVDGLEPDATKFARQAAGALAHCLTVMASVPQALNARLCVGANPYIGSRRVFDDRQALAGRPGSDLST
jgi:hypothetical protein